MATTQGHIKKGRDNALSDGRERGEGAYVYRTHCDTHTHTHTHTRRTGGEKEGDGRRKGRE